MKRIICLIDFSETSLNALEFATNLCQNLKSELTLAYIFTETEFNKIINRDEIGDLSSLKDEALEKMKAIASGIDKTRKQSGLSPIKCVIESGQFNEKVLDLISSQQADLIVMGTDGAGNIIESWLGSSSTQIVELSDVPVLIVPFTAQFSSLNSIVFASNFDEEELASLDQLTEIADSCNSALTVLHLYRNGHQPNLELEEKMKAKIGNSKANLISRHYDGDMTLAIDHYMNENDSDLLALVKTERNFIERLFNPGLTRRMTYLVKYPLLVFKANN